MAKKDLTQPTFPTNNVQSLADQVQGQAPLVKTTFDQASIDIKSYINALLVELADETSNNSGSNTIGHNSTSITADNVGDALEENRLLIDAIETELGANVVKTSGNQTINGIKTFVQNVVVPLLPTATTHATSKQYVDDLDAQNVKITGNQFVDGIKTFLQNIVVPLTPTQDAHAASKKYVDSQAPLTIPNDSVTNAKMATDVKIGSLNTLVTIDKDSVTNAINEVAVQSITPKQVGGGYFQNGDFKVNQRGQTTLVSGQYFMDRVFATFFDANTTWNWLENITDNPRGATHGIEIINTSGSSNFVGGFVRRIESKEAKNLFNKTITISFDVWATESKVVNVDLAFANAQDDFSAVTSIGFVAFTTEAGQWKTVEAQFDLTNVNLKNGIQVAFNTQTSGNEIANGSKYIYTLNKLEEGEKRSDYIFEDEAENELRCQRYAEPLGYGVIGFAQSTTAITFAIPYKTTKRGTPSLSIPTSFTVADIPFTSTFTAVVANIDSSVQDKNGIRFIQISGFVGLTAGKAYIPETANDIIFVDSEL